MAFFCRCSQSGTRWQYRAHNTCFGWPASLVLARLPSLAQTCSRGCCRPILEFGLRIAVSVITSTSSTSVWNPRVDLAQTVLTKCETDGTPDSKQVSGVLSEMWPHLPLPSATATAAVNAALVGATGTYSKSNQAKKAELPRRFLERLQLHHAILLPGNPHPFVGRGGIPSVSIEVEKRQGNRFVNGGAVAVSEPPVVCVYDTRNTRL